ncbi:MAG: hypothetical protein PHQ60_10930 [Sideroxydans sp.]|nr:hypothetical protein [Sideroxydans sp.]
MNKSILTFKGFIFWFSIQVLIFTFGSVAHAAMPTQDVGGQNERGHNASSTDHFGTSSSKKEMTAAKQAVAEQTKEGNRVTLPSDETSGKARDGVFVARDEITFYGGIFQILAWFITVAAVIFGAIVGVNVFQGKSILEDARDELKSLRAELSKVQDAKKKYEDGFDTLSGAADKLFKDTVAKIQAEVVRSLEDLVHKEFEITTAARYKVELLDELEKDKPDEKYVYIRLTDIINYPDIKCLRIYAACTTKLSNSRDVMHIVTKGLRIAAENTGNSINS